MLPSKQHSQMVEETPGKTALARGFLVLTLVHQSLACGFEEVFKQGKEPTPFPRSHAEGDSGYESG